MEARGPTGNMPLHIDWSIDLLIDWSIDLLINKFIDRLIELSTEFKNLLKCFIL